MCNFLIAIWTLGQGIVYFGLSIVAILALNCTLELNDSRFIYLLKATFFHHGKCGNIDWNFLTGEQVLITPDVPEITSVVKITRVFLILYLILSILWILTSVLLLINSLLCGTPCKLSVHKVLLFPWIYTTIGNLLLDLAACGFFAYCLHNSWTVHSFFQLLEIQNSQELEQHVDPSAPVYLAALTMLLLSIRWIIVWLMNCSMICAVHRTLSRYEDLSKPGAATLNYGQPIRNPATNISHSNQSQRQSVDRYSSPNQNLYSYNNPNYLHPDRRRQNNAPNARFMETTSTAYRTVEPLKGGENNRSDDGSDGHTWSSNNDNLPTIQVDSRRNNNSHFLSDLINEQQQRISRQSMQPNNTQSEQTSKQSPPPYRESHQYNVPGAHAVPPEELRGQLPWSYFQSRDDVKRPKRPMNQINDDEDLPPVPVPDYTLHFPRKERPSNSDNGRPIAPPITPDYDGRWSGPEHQY